MPKMQTPAGLPGAARPPRPASRVRAEAGTGGAGSGLSAPASHSEFRRAGGAEGPQAINSPLPDRLLEELASPPDSLFGSPRPVGLIDGLPLANLEGPSMASLDLTPSPVPRVSLAPAPDVDDISLSPGPNVDPRNLPTLAACHVLGPARPRAPAPAVTFPPHRELNGEASVSQASMKGVRSSKREIALGLTIGVGLSVLLGGVGQAYLERRRQWQAEAPRSIETATLSALPQPAPGAPPPPSAAADGSPSTPAPSPPTEARRHAARSAPGASDVSPALARRASTAAPSARSTSTSTLTSPRRSTTVGATPPRASGAAPGEVNASQASSEQGPEKTPLSPSESAGLGLDLPL